MYLAFQWWDKRTKTVNRKLCWIAEVDEELSCFKLPYVTIGKIPWSCTLESSVCWEAPWSLKLWYCVDEPASTDSKLRMWFLCIYFNCRLWVDELHQNTCAHYENVKNTFKSLPKRHFKRQAISLESFLNFSIYVCPCIFSVLSLNN